MKSFGFLGMSMFSRRVPFDCGFCELCFGLIEHYRGLFHLHVGPQLRALELLEFYTLL